MKRFAELYRALDETTKTNRKVEAMRAYFQAAAPEDAAWAVYFLTGRRPKRLLRGADLWNWCIEAVHLPGWLLEECVSTVGDFAETIALLLDDPQTASDAPLHVRVEQLFALGPLEPDEQRRQILGLWSEMSRQERLVWNKLLTGEFRVGVSQTLVVRALAELAELPPATVAHRMMGAWEPTADFFRGLLARETNDVDLSRPYPFCLAHPLADPPESLGAATDWQAEWKWDGIRAQVIQRQGQVSIWSRGEELLTERFPELTPWAARLPSGTVLDGEIVAWKDGRVLEFAQMQRRIARKKLGKKILEAVPARFIGFDVLEHEGRDVRELPLVERRAILETILPPETGSADAACIISPLQRAASWAELTARREASRDQNVEGLMLKALGSPYGTGRVTGLWWKWKVDPYSIDAVLVYAQLGHGRRAGLYTDYTFALWNAGVLVPFAKAYSGLTDEEIREVDRFVRQNTLEKVGPVRQVEPQLVFEIAFEGIQLSKRHKSGIAVRFPRMVRWRKDKDPREADTLEGIQRLLTTPSTDEAKDQ